MSQHRYTRSRPCVIRTRSRLKEVIWPTLACTMLVGLLAWGHQVDSNAAQADALAAAHESGRLLGQQQMAETVADAYHQGQRDVLLAGGRP